MKELLDLIIVKALPEGTEFSVTEREGETPEIVVFDIKLPEEFKGRIIGKMGRNINAIRQVMSVIAKQENRRVQVEVLD
jgi:predicted RNA-binding protein YlqC (UPF0109 family)